MLRFLIPSYLLSVLLENLSGGLRGLGDVLWPTIFTFGGLFFVRLPWIIILTKMHHKGGDPADQLSDGMGGQHYFV